MSPRNEEPPGYWPARAALLCLRAAVPPGATARQMPYAILPNPTPLSAEAAARALALMPKPVRCTPDPRPEVLALRCRAPEGSFETARHAARLRDARRHLENVRARYGGGNASDLVLHVRGPGESFLLPVAEVERLYCDYEIINPYPDFGYGRGVDDPDRAAQALGAAAILRITSGPSSPWADVSIIRTREER